MKVVDMRDVFLVHSGDDWRYEQLPCNKQMISHLEKNEGIVSWLQPKSGLVDDQFPAIKIKDYYYTLSLRMMKAIWRNVRLRKGFINMERAPYGGHKLKIPSLLYTEKMRTQHRFNVKTQHFCLACIKTKLE